LDVKHQSLYRAGHYLDRRNAFFSIAGSGWSASYLIILIIGDFHSGLLSRLYDEQMIILHLSRRITTIIWNIVATGNQKANGKKRLPHQAGYDGDGKARYFAQKMFRSYVDSVGLKPPKCCPVSAKRSSKPL